MFPKQRSSVRLSVRALNRFETALIQRLIALSGSEQMSTSPANPPGYGPPPSTLPKSLHRLSEQLITIARQQSRFYRRPWCRQDHPGQFHPAHPRRQKRQLVVTVPTAPRCGSASRPSTMLTSAGRTSVHFRVLKPRPGPGHKPRRLHNQSPRGDRPQRPPFALSPERRPMLRWQSRRAFAEAFAPAKETVGRQGLRLCRVPRLAVPARHHAGHSQQNQSPQTLSS